MPDMEPSLVEYRELMDSVFDRLVDDVVEMLRNGERDNACIHHVVSFFRYAAEYNVRGGKMLRAFLFLAVYNATHKCGSKADPGKREGLEICKEHVTEQIRLLMLAWSIEFLQASFLIGDDIMDISPVRRGKPAWYTVVAQRNRLVDTSHDDTIDGLPAINDIFLLLYCSFFVVFKYFPAQQYRDLTSELHDAFFRTIIGQSIDMDRGPGSNSACECLKQVSETEDHTKIMPIIDAMEARYSCIVKYKTSFYSFRLPILLACTLVEAENTCREQSFPSLGWLMEFFVGKDDIGFDRALLTDLACQMGLMFQMRDDMLDWCTDLAESLKSMYTDIVDCKLTWPLIACLRTLAGKSDFQTIKDVCEKYGKQEHTQYMVELYKANGVLETFLSKTKSLRETFSRSLLKLNNDDLSCTLDNFMNGIV